MTFDKFLTEELIETTFLYCYKRLNDTSEAEDLAQDILLEALRTVRKGEKIFSFYSWYWRLAHNRYCLHLRMKKNNAVSIDVFGGSISSELDFTEDLIKQEDVSALNFVISRLSTIHRQIIIHFYLKEQKIADIAKSLDLPEGTVKRRLFNARKEIKEGVLNMNNYGKQSYAPADLQLYGSYGIPNHWDSINDIMTKQIFVACMDKPVSISQIADEIGVAPLYFEEKINYLLENKFIKESSKGRYIADFCIFPAQVNADFNYELSQLYGNIGQEITDEIISVEADIRKLNFYGSDFSLDYLLWIFYVYACSVISKTMLSEYKNKWIGKVPDSNGKDYRIAGKVTLANENVTYKDCKLVSWSNLHNHFQTADYRHITYANLFEMEPFSDRDIIISDKNINTIMKVYDNPCVELTKVEEEQIANLISVGYIKKELKGLYLTFPVMTNECQNQIEEILRKRTFNLANKYVEPVSNLGEKFLFPYVREDLFEEYVNWIMLGSFLPLNRVMYYAMEEAKTLAIPDDYSKSAAGICLYINK